MKSIRIPLLLGIIAFITGSLRAADPYISEFVASNTAGVSDSDGSSSDWIEIYNPGPTAVNLQGWYLSNDPLVLTKWVFPSSLNLNSGSYVYVWASNKAGVAGHSPDAGGRYHTNFTLSKGGGSVLLVKPDGTTVTNPLAPSLNPYDPYPAQADNISYGVGAPVVSTTTLLAIGETAKYHVPSSAALGSTWTIPAFDDSSWNSGATGIGYDTTAGGTGPLPIEIEPNNTAPTASNGSANFSSSAGTKYQLAISGSIVSVGDVDFYNLGAMDATSGGDVLAITVSGANGSRGTLANPTLELWRNNGGAPVLVATDADGGPGVDSQIYNYTVSVADTYFAKVTGDTGTGTYALSVLLSNRDTVPSSATPTVATEAEAAIGGNDTAATAKDLSTSWRLQNYTSTTNGLVGAGDVDFYKFSVVANTILTFNALSTSGVELRCSVVDSTGVTTLAAEDGTSSGQGNNSRIFCYRAPASGFQYIQVQSVTGSGSYTLEVSTSSTNAPSAPTSLSTLIGKNIEFEMKGINPTVYIRVPFTVTDLSQVSTFTLRMRYKDGLIAFLNGTEVVRNNVGDATSPTAVAVAAPTLPPYNGHAPASRTTATTPIDYDITSQVGNLQVGTNFLCLLGQVFTTTGATCLVLPELEITGSVNGVPQFFATPSPGIVNTSGALGQVADTKFSVNRGFFTSTQSVIISTATGGVQIRYTTNGDAPTATTGTLYTGPITISATTVLRAAAFKTGYVPSNVDTQTYIFTTDVVNQQTAGTPPTGWPAANATNGDGAQNMDYGMDTAVTGDATWGPQMQAALNALPSISIVTDLTSLFGGSGIYSNPSGDGAAWERAASMEIINPNNTPGVQINCGLRVRGGYSRSQDNPKHSFRFFFRDDYAGGGKLNFPLFGDTGAQSFSKMDLRTSQNYSWAFGGDARNIMCRDVFFRDLQRDSGKPYTRSVYYNLYLNGQYWGLFQTQERSEAQYGATYFGGDNDEYDTIKVAPDGTQVGTNGFNTGYTLYATDGNFSAWDALRKYCYALLTAPGAGGAGMTQNANYFYIQGKNADGTDNPAYPVLLDVENMQDYMIGIYYGGNCDAPVSQFLSNNRPNNWYGMRRTSPQDVAYLPGGVPPTTRPLGKIRSEGFRFFAHDNEHTIVSGNSTGSVTQLLRNRVQDNNGGTQTGTYVGSDAAFDQLQYSNPQGLHLKLMANPEYAQKFADRIQKSFYGNGPLTAANSAARLTTRSNQISTAIIAESARWGNAKVSPARTKTNWTTEMNFLFNTYMPARSNTVVGQLQAAGWFPASTVGPTFSQYGGTIPAGGYTLTIANPNAGGGIIYYTTNGSDPRLIGGGISPSAQTGTSTPLSANTTRVKARVLTTGVWSPMTDERFAKVQSDLRVAEIMYNPGASSPSEISAGYADSENFEFIELVNSGASPINLEGCRFSVGIFFDFANTTLAPGARLVLVHNAAAFALRYPGVTVGGQFVGDFDNGGERLVLVDATGSTILDFTYNDKWLKQTDGDGFSLTSLDPRASSSTLSTASGWRASAAPAGSPSAGDTGVAAGSVVINEILAYPNVGGDQFVEIRNLDSVSSVDVGGWYLSDDGVNLTKYRIAAGTTIAPSGYLVLTASANFNNAGDTGSLVQFTINRKLGALYLSSGSGSVAGGYREDVDFSGSAQGVSLGLYTRFDGSTNFVPQSAVTSGAVNSGPKIGPVVINEFNYNPFSTASEFVEFYNTTPAAIALDGWSVSEGVVYTFPPGTTIGAYGYVVVTGGNPTTVRTTYAIPVATPVLGPWTGSLDNSGETIRISRPGDAMPDLTIPLISVDHVNYDAVAPWPTQPNGSGPTLQRINSVGYGNDVVNWASFTQTAGRLNFDTDGDGIPDAWETANGLNPLDNADAALDTDGDTASNLLEYLAGTNPLSAASVFRVETVAATGPGGAFVITFNAAAGRTYTVQYRTDLTSGAWLKVADVPAQGSAASVQVTDTDSIGQPKRFYRIASPAQ